MVSEVGCLRWVTHQVSQSRQARPFYLSLLPARSGAARLPWQLRPQAPCSCFRKSRDSAAPFADCCRLAVRANAHLLGPVGWTQEDAPGTTKSSLLLCFPLTALGARRRGNERGEADAPSLSHSRTKFPSTLPKNDFNSSLNNLSRFHERFAECRDEQPWDG